jgi:uncharacterized membrane protein YkoI
MTDRFKNMLLIVLSITALALGGSAIAGAASGGGGSSSSNNNNSSPAPSANRGPAGLPPQRSDETLLTGDTAARVREAALAKVSGGTIERVETDADGHAAYEAHMVRSDGSRVTVYVDKSFNVVSVENGP